MNEPRDAIAQTMIYGGALGYRQADMVLASLAAAGFQVCAGTVETAEAAVASDRAHLVVRIMGLAIVASQGGWPTVWRDDVLSVLRGSDQP